MSHEPSPGAPGWPLGGGYWKQLFALGFCLQIWILVSFFRPRGPKRREAGAADR